MGTGEFNIGILGVNQQWTSTPPAIKGEVKILLVRASCYRKRDKLRPDGPLGSYADNLLSTSSSVAFILKLFRRVFALIFMHLLCLIVINIFAKFSALKILSRNIMRITIRAMCQKRDDLNKQILQCRSELSKNCPAILVHSTRTKIQEVNSKLFNHLHQIKAQKFEQLTGPPITCARHLKTSTP